MTRRWILGLFSLVVFWLMAYINRSGAWYNSIEFRGGLLLGWAIAGGLVCLMPWSQPNPEAAKVPVLRKWRVRAYLVVHIDLRVFPPVARFVQIYSCSAKDLTMTGLHEARAYLYMVEADTFQEAHDEMRRVAPLYFPWIKPLMTRGQ